ncbi:unnamed protein product [Arctia plantaginis]|uniref:GRIP domain-containing protein n=1 Tax=Arctia plantaginis TaxID=874455 RepID=A0A8S0ZW27_ARCPL|nr:unnamed protein product [Arctia plantaginis]
MEHPESSNQDVGPKKGPFDDLGRDELVTKCKGFLAIAQKAKLAKSELQTTVETYKAQLEKSQSKIKALSAKCVNYEETINSHKADLIVRDKTISDLNQKLCDIDIEVTSLQRQNKRLLEENEQLLNQLTEFESKISEFNSIGMQQREQLKILEGSVQTEEHYKNKIDELNTYIKQLENNVQGGSIDYKTNLEEVEKELHEVKQNKLNFNTNDGQLSELTRENISLKQQLDDLNQKLTNSDTDNSKLLANVDELRCQLELIEKKLPIQLDENKSLKEKLNESTQKLNEINHKYDDLQKSIHVLKTENQVLNEKLQTKMQQNEVLEHLNLQVKALESEKSILVKEKLNARDSVEELEKQNKNFSDKLTTTKQELLEAHEKLEQMRQQMRQERIIFEKKNMEEKEGELNILKCNLRVQHEQFNLLKKEHDDLQDLNSLLKEEVETLKLSLEQPKDDSENLSDLNVSLQADIVKLETKLATYKQENALLLVEVKEARNKSKEFEALVVEYEDAKSKLGSYKSENTELLNEMKEINQVLKERGEAISKLQKAITEMEKLVETLEKDRDTTSKEKDELLEKIENLKSDLNDAKLKTSEKAEASHEKHAEINNAKKDLITKDAIIVSLKEEIEKLKQQSSGELPNEDMSTSTISKAEEHTRMKDLDETFEEKYSKLRIFALKLKKKLNETTNELKQAVQDKAKLEKLLNDNRSMHAETGIKPGEHIESDNPKVDNNTGNQSQINELEAKVNSLTEALEATKNVTNELDRLKAESALKTQQLATEVEAHKVTQENLEKARRDVKMKNVLSLEMKDYERSMKELSTKMEESKKKIIQMESTIDTQEGTITAMRTQIKLLEEQVKTEERQNRLAKEELQHAIEEAKEKDNLIQMKNTIIGKIEQDLEDEKRKNEESDLEMTSLLGEKEKVIMSLGEEKAALNYKLKKMEFKCAELTEKLRIVNIELADLKAEYTSYKVRAQAVLRQNQTVDHSQEEQLKEEAAALRAQIETLTAKLTTTQEQVHEKSAEVESARRRVAETTNELNRAQQRTSRLHADLARLSQQIESERTQNKLQVTTLTQCYKTQISELEAKLQRETEHLKKQLAAAELSGQSGNADVMSLDTANRNQFMMPVIPKDENSDGELDINVSMIPREEGEGSESAPSPPPSKPYLNSGGGTRSPVPLERLLEEGVPDDEAMDTSSLSLTPEQEISDLKRRLQAQQQRVKHVTVLLSESERECARMAQLSELLKAELRRVRGATHNAHNTEYMKNVTLKFLTLPPGDERSRLVPVLQKILTLTQDETHKIQAIAKGLDPNPSKGWGSYLPWSGGT